jgi:hypothetical protein
MSTVDRFSESLQATLTKMDQQLDSVKSDLVAMRQHDKAAIQARLQAVRLSIEDGKLQAQAAEGKLKGWLRAKEEAGVAVIQGWKDKREQSKLEHHAERAEGNAEGAICLAEAAMTNAILATYEALDARMSADDGPAA